MNIRSAAAAVIALIIVLTCFSGCSDGAEGSNTNVQETAYEVLYEEAAEDAAADVGCSAVSDSASAAIIYCADNGEVLYGHNINDKRAIASITKIMTAVVALEYAASYDKEVKITPAMYAEGSSMYLKEGEILKLSEIVKGMMSVSGNDAANAVALSVGGSMEKFSDMMNDKARQIGMKNTHFVTPSGLDSEEHYSTAYDMALLCAYAMENETFREIVSQKNIDVSYIYPENKMQTLTNHNRLLSLYDGCIGIKTGYTMKAGRTLTSCAERDGVRLIVVTLNDGNDWDDHCGLYDYGFSVVERIRLADENRRIEIPVAGEENETAVVVPERNMDVTVKKEDKDRIEEHIYLPRFLFSPVGSSTMEGTIEYTLDGKVISTARLITEK